MKYSQIVLVFAWTICGLSVYGITHPNFDLAYFMDLGIVSAYIRCLFAIWLLMYTLYKPIRNSVTQIYTMLLGITALGLGVTALFSPLLLGHLPHYVPLGDVFMLFEGGVLGMLMGLELPARKVQLQLPTLFYLYTYPMQRLLSYKPRQRLISTGKPA